MTQPDAHSDGCFSRTTLGSNSRVVPAVVGAAKTLVVVSAAATRRRVFVRCMVGDSVIKGLLGVTVLGE